MGKKVKNCMVFSGYASNDVTGSEIAINYNGKNILIECGLHQSSDVLKAYNANVQKLPVKASKIDYVFIMHTLYRTLQTSMFLMVLGINLSTSKREVPILN